MCGQSFGRDEKKRSQSSLHESLLFCMPPSQADLQRSQQKALRRPTERLLAGELINGALEVESGSARLLLGSPAPGPWCRLARASRAWSRYRVPPHCLTISGSAWAAEPFHRPSPRIRGPTVIPPGAEVNGFSEPISGWSLGGTVVLKVGWSGPTCGTTFINATASKWAPKGGIECLLGIRNSVDGDQPLRWIWMMVTSTPPSS